jgi:type IV secretory pathway TraG/TraD family ATPase VirD4
VAKRQSDFDLRQIMDDGRIFIANLSKGKLGEDGSALLGSLLSTKFELAALSRTTVPIEQRRDFILYVDEFPSLAGSSFIGMLSESRKYKLALVLAMQFIEQL